MYIYHALINGLCVSLSWTVGAVLYCPLLCFGLFHFLAGAKPFFFLALACGRISIKIQSIESRHILGPENTLFAGVCMHFSAWEFYGLGQ